MDIEKINEAARYIISKTRVIPKIAIVLGSGLGCFAEKIEERIEIPYRDIPDFPVSTVAGHEGKFVFGKLRDKYVIAMQGRIHYYEGYSMQEITMPIWTLSKMGVQTIILTNAAGGINESYEPGDLVVLVDHIKMTADSPLRGISASEHGTGFIDMTRAYTPELIELAKEVAYGIGVGLEDGVYAFMGGPQFETPAEIRMLSLFGADLVGMSTVPEVIVANHCKMNVLAISCITNLAAGIQNKPLSHEDVLEISSAIDNKFDLLLDGIVERIKTE